MADINREVIALRNFEELDNSEAAHVLGISPAAARKRDVRARKRLQDVLSRFPGLLENDGAQIFKLIVHFGRLGASIFRDTNTVLLH